jgi:Disulfide bond formation protein DsbB
MTGLVAATPSVQRASLLFALLAVLVQVLVVVGVVWWIGSALTPRWRTALDGARRRHGRAALWLAAAVAIVATLGSLWFSEVADLPPCRLCWFQRCAMYPLAVVLTVAAIRRDRRVAWYAAPLALLGLAVSIYHYLVEWHPSWETSCDPVNPCSLLWFGRRFGYLTLPSMAGTGFVGILLLVWFAWSRVDATPSDVGRLDDPVTTDPDPT